MASNLFSARIDYEERKPEPRPDLIKMQMIYEEPAGVSILPIEPEQPEESEEKESPQAFVQTNEGQESEAPPQETDLIGERDTTATSDQEAVAGQDGRAALSGNEEAKYDPKTFDSDFDFNPAKWICISIVEYYVYIFSLFLVKMTDLLTY